MNKASVTKTNGYRTYSKVSQEDWTWIRTQEPCVQQLWIECMEAERYGEHFNVIQTRLSRNSFAKAKLILEKTQRFEFQSIQEKSEAGRWLITGWKVRNLHGTKIDEYWKLESLLAQQMGDDAQQMGDDAQQMGDDAQQMGDENAVAFDTTAFSSPLLGNYKENNKKSIRIEPSSKTRSGRCDGSAPFRVAAASASDAELFVKEEEATQTPETVVEASPATQLTKDPGEEEIPILFSKNKTAADIEVISEQLVVKEVSSAAPHVKMKQNNLSSNENEQEGTSKSMNNPIQQIAAEHCSKAQERAAQKKNKDHPFDDEVEKAIAATKQLNLDIPIDFWMFFSYAGKQNALVPMVDGLKQHGHNVTSYLPWMIGDYMVYRESSSQLLYYMNVEGEVSLKGVKVDRLTPTE